jgi:predicted RNase H-like HicB family nuclease
LQLSICLRLEDQESILIATEEKMELAYTYWQDGDFFVGFLNDYPNDSTQGKDLAELEESLAEVYEIRQEEQRHLAVIRRTGTLRILA